MLSNISRRKKRSYGKKISNISRSCPTTEKKRSRKNTKVKLKSPIKSRRKKEGKVTSQNKKDIVIICMSNGNKKTLSYVRRLVNLD